jgi:hypothetical protein
MSLGTPGGSGVPPEDRERIFAGVGGASTRLANAIVPVVGGGHLRLGFASYDRHYPQTIQQLLARAREGLRPIRA